MLRSFILSAVVLTSVNLIYGQTTNYKYLFTEWNEGRIDEKGNVVGGESRRGGWDNLILNRDSTVTYSGAVLCGFGSKRTGIWKLDTQNALITFLFDKTEGYMNNPESGDINLTETYLIKKLTQSELILLYQNSSPPRQIAFFKN